MVPVTLDWVLGLMLELRVRREVAEWEAGAELGVHRGAEDTDVVATVLVTTLWTVWFGSTTGRARATVCNESEKKIRILKYDPAISKSFIKKIPLE